MALPGGTRWLGGLSHRGSQDQGAQLGIVEKAHLEQRIDVETKFVGAPDAPGLVLRVHREQGRPDMLAREPVLEASARAQNVENAAICRVAFHRNDVVLSPFDHRQRGGREQTREANAPLFEIGVSSIPIGLQNVALAAALQRDRWISTRHPITASSFVSRAQSIARLRAPVRSFRRAAESFRASRPAAHDERTYSVRTDLTHSDGRAPPLRLRRTRACRAPASTQYPVVNGTPEPAVAYRQLRHSPRNARWIGGSLTPTLLRLAGGRR